MVRCFSFFQLLLFRIRPFPYLFQVLVSFSCYADVSEITGVKPEVLVSFSCYNVFDNPTGTASVF